MAYAKIRPRRGTATQWATANPVLMEGEQGIEVPDSGIGTGIVKMKFGDGVTAWNDLPYGVLSTDTVDNLLSEATDLPLSANQGRLLGESIDKLNKAIATFEILSNFKSFNASANGYIDILTDGYDYVIPLGVKSGYNLSNCYPKTDDNGVSKFFIITNGSTAQTVTAYWLGIKIG